MVFFNRLAKNSASPPVKIMIKFGQDKIVDGPAGNLRKDNLTFRRQLVKNCKQRENFFTNRVEKNWNKLPFETKKAKSVNSFKARIDKLGYGFVKEKK